MCALIRVLDYFSMAHQALTIPFSADFEGGYLVHIWILIRPIHLLYTDPYTCSIQTHTLALHRSIHLLYTDPYTCSIQTHTLALHRSIHLLYTHPHTCSTQTHTLALHSSIYVRRQIVKTKLQSSCGGVTYTCHAHTSPAP